MPWEVHFGGLNWRGEFEHVRHVEAAVRDAVAGVAERSGAAVPSRGLSHPGPSPKACAKLRTAAIEDTFQKAVD